MRACSAPCLPVSARPCRGRPAGVAPRPGEPGGPAGRQVAPAPSIRSPAAEQRTPQTIPSAAAKLNNLPAPRALPEQPPPSPLRRQVSGSGRARNRQPGRGYRSGATSLGLLAAYADTGQGKLENGGEASGSLEGGLGIAVRGCGERPGRGLRSPGLRGRRGALGRLATGTPRSQDGGRRGRAAKTLQPPASPPPLPSAPRRGGGRRAGARVREREGAESGPRCPPGAPFLLPRAGRGQAGPSARRAKMENHLLLLPPSPEPSRGCWQDGGLGHCVCVWASRAGPLWG